MADLIELRGREEFGCEGGGGSERVGGGGGGADRGIVAVGALLLGFKL